MAHNSLSPGFIKLYYTNTGIQHVQTFSVDVVDPVEVGEEPSFFTKSGGTTLMSTFIDQYVSLLRPCFNTVVDLNNAEYWDQPDPESDPVWVYSHPIGLLGTSALANQLMTQIVTSIRTAQGGIFKYYLMEPALLFTNNTIETWPFAAGVYTTLMNYIISGAACFQGRDNGDLVVPIRRSVKTNDALRKRRLLI